MATSFGQPHRVLSAFGSGSGAGGWSSQNLYPRLLADVNGEGNADIVGFASNGVYVSLADALGGFFAPTFVAGSSFWGAQTGGWSSQDAYPREIADVNGDNMADIVGFAQSGIYMSLSTGGGGTFGAPTLIPNSSFWGANTGGWSSNDLYPRELANITKGDRKADIVGFAQDGVWTSLAFEPLGGAPVSSPDVALLSQYMAGSFATSSDGSGGTLITDTAPPTQPDWLTSPHP